MTMTFYPGIHVCLSPLSSRLIPSFLSHSGQLAGICIQCSSTEFDFYLISSLEELKDLSDKPEIMDAFLTKVESVSSFILLIQSNSHQ